MKALFTQDSKGPPEFICELYWCFPCHLKGINEEVALAVLPQAAGGPPVSFHRLPSLTEQNKLDWWPRTRKHSDLLVLMGTLQLRGLCGSLASSRDREKLFFGARHSQEKLEFTTIPPAASRALSLSHIGQFPLSIWNWELKYFTWDNWNQSQSCV